MQEPVVDFGHDVRIQFFLDIIVQIDARAGGYDGLDFRHQGIHVQPAGLGDVFQGELAVDGLDDGYLVAGFGGDGLDDKVVRTFDLVFFHVFRNQVHEGLAELPGLSFPDPLALFGKFLERKRIYDGHVFQGRVGKDDPGLEPELAGQVFPEVLEHGEQDRVSTASAMDGGREVVFLVVFPFGESAVLHQHHFMGVQIELQAFIGGVDEAVILDILVQVVQDEPLVDDSGPEALVVVFSGAEQRQLVVPVGLDHGVGDPGQDGRQVLQLEMFRKGFDEFDHQGQLLLAVEAGFGMEAVVAAAAVVLGIILAEVVQEQFPAALAGFGIGDRFPEQLFADFLFRDGFALHEFFQFLDVLVAVIGDAPAFLTVTAGAARFLIVAFNALGNVVVDDKADVRLVDSHSESNGGHDDIDLLHQELVLVVGPGFGVQAGVVRKGLDAVDGKHLGHFLHLFTTEAVDDAAFAGVLADEADDVLLRLHFVPHFVIEIGPVEGGLEHPGVLDAEILEDVALHFQGGGSRQGDDGSRLDLVDDGTDFPVFGTEVMAPFGDAVGLVHSVEGDFDFLQQGDVLFFGEGLGGDVQQFGDAAEQVLLDFLDLDAGEGGIQEMGDAVVAGFEAADGVHLVFHEGDQGRNHDGGPFHDERRELVTQ